MYDINKFRKVELYVFKSEMTEFLLEDMGGFINRYLFEVESDDNESLKFKGLMRVKDLNRLKSRRDASPYGRDYKIISELNGMYTKGMMVEM